MISKPEFFAFSKVSRNREKVVKLVLVKSKQTKRTLVEFLL